ncbi:protein of unknown function [Taphrina deformans PYCC 5710]|uniref:Uncharacterized protein n=1 Tax=Taphrina deformans (strain PYCC 5710 / ATCC 11124 / CBS 356.35 / IMI 108563 / JCM 9778 / NBRC 8474) TaxID=1097556 RepID=R4XJF9_TAPDE|nr:protein of unknown function [Taphrina deformans PYCC 5710]|eukprot:CCG84596.1 protein of unknown function [Taphrina deformans PYCC 5710]
MALSHFLYTFSVTILIIASILYYFRGFCSSLLPAGGYRDRLGRHLSLPSFAGDIESGLTSEDFDLSRNVEEGDGRVGLDGPGRAQVQRIMRTKRCTFDQARLILLQDKMKRAGIDPQTGLPRDAKFVSFS